MAAAWETIFLIPNLHCPSCISVIESLMGNLNPAPTIKSTSIIGHSVTVLHDKSLLASTISQAFCAAGFEVFDIVLDPRSTEKVRHRDGEAHLFDVAIERWSPEQPEVEGPAHEKHRMHCRACATASGKAELESVIVDGAYDQEPPDYVAVLAIEGMTCSSCIGNVERAIEEVSSVTLAEVSLVNHSATIHFAAEDAGVEVQRLREVIEDVGYGADLVELKPQSTQFPDETNDNDLWEATYAIEGMTCSSCISTVTSAVTSLPFVQRADINLVQHSGTVVFEGKDQEGLIRQAIEEVGYDVTRTELRSLADKTTKASSRTVSLTIRGMHCPYCPERVVAAIKALPVQVQKSPSLEDPVLTLSYTPDAPHLTIRALIHSIRCVDDAFSVSVYKPPTIEERSRKMLARERKAILARVALSIITAIPTFILGVVYMNLVPHSDSGYAYLAQTLHGVSRLEWATFVMATPVYFFATDHFHTRTWRELYALWRPRSTVPVWKRFLRFGSMNMLISFGTTIAYFSSLAQLIIAAANPAMSSSESSKQSYFDSVVFLTMFLLMGRFAEAQMKAKSGDAVAALGKLRPTEALLMTAKSAGEKQTDEFEKVSVDLIDTGDIVRILPGSSPPCDGTLIDETAEFDESSLTGESRIVNKTSGDPIYSGTINRSSAITICVSGPAGASMLDSIIQVVREGQARRAPLERVADLLTAYFVPVIVVIAIVTWMIWLALGESGVLPTSYLDSDTGGWPFWSLQFAIAVFVIACPCGLGLAAPTALFVGGGMAAKRGVLVKGGGEAFQEASNLDCVVFDKTGTLTEGAEPKVVQNVIFDVNSEYAKERIFGVLKSVEQNSGHPLARAVVAFAASQTFEPVNVVSSEEIAGKGLRASLNIPDDHCRFEALVGNESLMQDYGVDISPEASKLLDSWKMQGHSIILLACRPRDEIPKEFNLLAAFAAADSLRPEAAEVVASLQSRNVDVWMLSGDNPETATVVGGRIGIPSTNIIAGVLPAQKAEKIRFLQQSQSRRRKKGFLDRFLNKSNRATVAMVGDGINDAPALATADVGIAVASGSDVAVQSASFILLHSDLRAVLTLVTLSKAVFQRVLLNFFWAAVYNLIALPIAAGVLYPITTSGGGHVRLDPAWAALAMALSSVSVVGSSLLLRSGIPGVGFRG